ncbi:MAG: TolC family protein [Clostridium sp.]|jgi:outer membrane protein TolC|uniref:TolC family protein n=1 Tax=Clostridium sp. TaxID=1506 RepID=UPI0025BD2528|nr:TolC family protein [Clostridium sp.]MCH3965030.1 TolC family protein [Clostridium sp.]MCI1714251.1 TolC family protein [Clostridium sp.]MCI1798513.1 TolC family protein [Clostridium sp.]MCI1812756.1 TolC family protein [Clostridium sp.]MCI1869322.1 TolC family protein [Clostridium sp.]
MNKLKTAVLCILAIVFSGTPAFAAGNTLDIDASIDAAISSSYKVKSMDISIKQAQNSYDADVKNASSYADQLDQGGPDMDAYTRLSLMQGISNPRREDKFSEYKYTQMKSVAENEIKLSAYTQYTALMNDRDELDFENQKMANEEEKYSSAKSKLSLGLISPSDEKKAEADYNTQKAKLDGAQRKYDLDVMNMNKILGADLYTKYDTLLRDKFTETPYIRSYDEYLNGALEKRAEILVAQENINLQKFEYKVVSGVFPNTQSVPNRLAQANVDNASDSLEIQKLNIIPEINSLYNDLQVKNRMLKSKKDALALSKTRYDTQRVKYDVGVISKIDFDTAALDLKSAQNTVKAAQRDIWMAQFKLGQACDIGNDTSKIN